MSETKMRAAVYRGPGKIGIEEVPRPEPGPDEVRLRVGSCGLCGTDLHFLLHEWPFFQPGQIPGHEIAGAVDALGAGVSGIREGDRVAVEPLISCGSCRWCESGRESICPDIKLYGVQSPGGFAEYVVVRSRRLFRVPDEMDFRLAALAEPTAVTVHALLRGGLQQGQRVLVLGGGTIGLLSVAVAADMGAGEILLTARHPHQAALGKVLGASRILSESEASNEALADLTRSRPIDLVVETVGGNAETLMSACAALAPGGTAVILGVFTGSTAIDPLALVIKEINLIGSSCYARPPAMADFEKAIDFLSRKGEALGPLLTHAVPLDEIGRAYELAGDKSSMSVKVSVVPS